ncbi:MAG: putative redox protein [Pseudoalteromonas distincta]|jgi:putative redox protein
MSQEESTLEVFKATAKGSGWATKVNITGTEWTIQADETEEDGGTNTGPNPMQYFAASLASCQNEQAQVVAEEMELAIDAMDISLEIELDLAGFMGMAEHSNDSYKKVQLTHTVGGSITAEQVGKMGDAVDSRCPILGLLRNSGCEIDSSWTKA